MSLIIDLFAGGGGASEGIRMALGRDPDAAIDHNAHAVAMHKGNHPGTVHYCQDIWSVSPNWVTRGRPVSLLWASPDCTHFSKAKGAAPNRDEKRRDLAWVVEKWAREVRPALICLENVEEFATWGPLDRSGAPIKSQSGTTFRSFVGALRRLGYSVQWRELRACDYGAPTLRKRLFLIARCDGHSIVWPEPTHGPGRPNPYLTAADCIDWSFPCPSIFDRKKPLAENTLKRISVGIRRYVLGAGQPFVYDLKNIGTSRDAVVVDGQKQTLVSAFLAKHYGGVVGHGLEQPIGSVTTVDHHSLVTPVLVANTTGHAPNGVNAPVSALTTGRHQILAVAHTQRNFGQSVGQSAAFPLGTVTAGGGGKSAIVATFLTKYYGTGGRHSSMADPVHTIPTKDRMGLVTVTIQGQPYTIVDIGMRMLQPRELYRAQGFPDTYIIGDDPDQCLSLTKTEQVRMCGNSVCPPVAAAIVRANYVASRKREDMPMLRAQS